MRTYLGIGLAALLAAGCSQSQKESHPRWEYRTMEVDCFQHWMSRNSFTNNVGQPDLKESEMAKQDMGTFELPLDVKAELSDMGHDGWEMVSAVPEIETVPNVEYPGGRVYNPDTQKLEETTIKAANIRTGKILLIFKRQG